MIFGIHWSSCYQDLTVPSRMYIAHNEQHWTMMMMMMISFDCYASVPSTVSLRGAPMCTIRITVYHLELPNSSSEPGSVSDIAVNHCCWHCPHIVVCRSKLSQFITHLLLKPCLWTQILTTCNIALTLTFVTNSHTLPLKNLLNISAESTQTRSQTLYCIFAEIMHTLS